MTSPSRFSCVTAPAKVWQGVAMLSQELALLPERAETKTRLARARAGEAAAMERTQTKRPVNRRRELIKSSFGIGCGPSHRRKRADDAGSRPRGVTRDRVVPTRLEDPGVDAVDAKVPVVCEHTVRVTQYAQSVRAVAKQAVIDVFRSRAELQIEHVLAGGPTSTDPAGSVVVRGRVACHRRRAAGIHRLGVETDTIPVQMAMVNRRLQVTGGVKEDNSA